MQPSISRKSKVVLYILLLIFLSSISNLSLEKLNLTFFNIKNIKIFGLNNNEEKILISQLEPILNKNIFFIKKSDFENILNLNNFIHKFSVSKKYPADVYISIEHTTLIGKTILNGKKYFLGLNGKFIGVTVDNINYNVPNIFGNFNSLEFIDLYETLNENNFDISQISDFFYFYNNRWDIKTKNDLIIKLPNNKRDYAIKLVKKLIDNNNLEKKIIDLRVANQVIISNAS